MRRTLRKHKKRENRLSRFEFLKLKRWIMGLFCLATAIITINRVFAQDEVIWRRCDEAIAESRVTAICVIKNAPRVIFAGTEGIIYKSTDSAASWKAQLILKGERRKINYISYDPSNSYRIFAATENGLYISHNGGKDWKIGFKGKDELQKYVTSIAIKNQGPQIVFIGTKKGLFKSIDGGRRWSAENSFINKEIISTAIDKKGVYVCAADGAYFTKEENSWEKIYVSKTYEDIINTSDNGNEKEEEETARIRHICAHNNEIYLATDRGVLVLKDKVFQPLTDAGLLTEEIEFVLPTDAGIFAATKKGIFYYDESNSLWHSYSSALMTLNVNMLDATRDGKSIFAATDRGLYKAEFLPAQIKEVIPKSAPAGDYYNKAISGEPTIAEIQQAAIEYAEVSPEKIIWMRQAAKEKAFIPAVSFGIDGDVGRNLDIDRGGTNDRDFFIEGPKDKDWGWDMNFSWDLGDLIWSDDQTNIDVRSRLMVQLRNDILDEVTKLYFERRRLQLQLHTDPTKNEEHAYLNQLRMQELTANIDALTGGYLSDSIKNKNRDRSIFENSLAK